MNVVFSNMSNARLRVRYIQVFLSGSACSRVLHKVTRSLKKKG